MTDVPNMAGETRQNPDPLFVADRPSAADASGLVALLTPLATLVADPRADASLTIGVFGGAGSGKSSALQALLDLIVSRSSSLLEARIDAASVGSDPIASIAARIYDALCASGPNGATLAQDSAHAGRDPFAVAQEASERLGETKRKLDAERLSLNELDGRRARLVETVLYDSAGSRIESFARSNRSRLEQRLKSFGFLSNDPVATYKDLVRDVFERGGFMSRVGAFFHSLWAFRGQTKLIGWAIVLFLLAWGLEHLFGAREGWLGWLQTSGGEKLAPTVDLVRTNVGLLTGASRIAFWGGVLALVLVVLRALRFTLPIMRGVSLLRSDIDARRRELDGLIAHQTRRVDALEAESDAQSRRADEAARRAGAGTSTAAAAPSTAEHPFEDSGAGRAASAARAFIASVGGHIAGSSPTHAPGRIVLAVDNLDAVSAARAGDIVQAVHTIASRPGFVALLACDASRLWAGDRDGLQRHVQIPWNVDAARRAVAAAGDGAALDAPLGGDEERFLGALNEAFGASPRGVKRLRNLYRLARTQSSSKAAAAFLIAVDINGDADERAQIAQAVRDGAVDFSDGSRLGKAQRTVGDSLSAADLAAAAPIAAIYAGSFA